MARRDGIALRKRGFTLIELLVVILIIGIISVVALPTISNALNHRQVSEAGRILQGALVGARDKAIHDGKPCGVRLMPDPTLFSRQPPTVNGQPNPTAYQVDPTLPIAFNRAVPIESAPDYLEGTVSVFPSGAYLPAIRTVNGYSGVPCLVLEEAPVDPQTGAPNPPTSWFWNIRVGDRFQVDNAGPWYTVVGPMVVGPSGGNTEMFVNNGANEVLPGGKLKTTLPVLNGGLPCEYLLLADGRDDNTNGWIDEGWDGIDNDNDGIIDGASEWEAEAWQGALPSGAVNVPYAIRRRPAPSTNAREIALPTDIVIDATTVMGSQERSRFPIDAITRMSGTIDIVINPDGTVLPVTAYGTPASFSMGSTFFHFWMAERQDVASPSPTATSAPYLPIGQPTGTAVMPAGTTALKGEFALLSLNARTGQVSTTANPSFFNPQGVYHPANPFLPAEQGQP